MPASRKVHVKRVFRQNADGSNDEDVWIDVMRFDRVQFNFQATLEGKLGQLINYAFNWKDDRILDRQDSGDADNENNNPNRKTEQLKITNPDSPDDDTQAIELWIVDEAKIRLDGDEFGLSGQVVKHAFKNIPPGQDGAALSRKTTVIKVVNNDLGGLDMTQSNVDWDDYKHALQNGTTDDGQHLDVEVVDRFSVIFQVGNQRGGQTGILGQAVKYSFQNDLIEQLFDPGNPGAVDANGNPSVIRTDPLQYIVNVKWTTPPLKNIDILLGFVCGIYEGEYGAGAVASFSSSLPLVQSEMTEAPSGLETIVSKTIPYGKNTSLSIGQSFAVSRITGSVRAGLSYGATQSKPGSYESMLGGNNFTLHMTVTIPEGSMFGTPRQGTWSASASLGLKGQDFAKGQNGSYGSPSGPIFVGGTGPIWTLNGATAKITAHIQIDPPQVSLSVSIG